MAADEAREVASATTKAAAEQVAGNEAREEMTRTAQQLIRVHEQAQAMKVCGNEHFKSG
eukprot:CAMPEP_0115529844 /NCGR_PEP_ID=MMETSP0271-20121206/84176_1 /TAXON_ID=71861 /ORGANISM="Scrippsiella trochoidea, Strain CCMP3099" /LENGTH=58 /DNA_ID=CAMNT_0002961929 /DNA_START=17 /DNA_END=190 /DNA_ORIENTATION=-